MVYYTTKQQNILLPRHQETPQHSIFAPDRRSFELNQIQNKYGSFSLYRLYRENQRKLEEERRERLRQEELARQRAAQPKPWRPKQLRKRKANYCGRLQNW